MQYERSSPHECISTTIATRDEAISRIASVSQLSPPARRITGQFGHLGRSATLAKFRQQRTETKAIAHTRTDGSMDEQ